MLKYVPGTTTPRVQIEWVALSETTAIHASTDFNTVGKVTDTSFHKETPFRKTDLPSSFCFFKIFCMFVWIEPVV